MSVTRWKSHKAIKRELALGLKPARRMTDGEVIYHRGELIRELRDRVHRLELHLQHTNETIRLLASRLPVRGELSAQNLEADRAIMKALTSPSPQVEKHQEWNQIQKRFTTDRKKSGLTSAKRSRTRRLNLWRKKWQGSK